MTRAGESGEIRNDRRKKTKGFKDGERQGLQKRHEDLIFDKREKARKDIMAEGEGSGGQKQMETGRR